MNNALLKTILAGVAAITMGAAVANAGPLMDRIEAGEPIRIGFANEIPFAYPGDDGSPKGFVNAHALGVLAKMGYDNIEPVQTEWGGLIPGLNAGRFDIVTGGMNILASRCENIAFSEPMAKVGDAFIVAPGNPKKIGNYESLAENDAIMVTGAGYSNIEAAKAAGVAEDKIMQVPGQAIGRQLRWRRRSHRSERDARGRGQLGRHRLPQGRPGFPRQVQRGTEGISRLRRNDEGGRRIRLWRGIAAGRQDHRMGLRQPLD